MFGWRLDRLVSCVDDLQRVYSVLLALQNSEGHVDLRLVIAHLRLDLHFVEAVVLIKICDRRYAFPHQFAADLSAQK